MGRPLGRHTLGHVTLAHLTRPTDGRTDRIASPRRSSQLAPDKGPRRIKTLCLKTASRRHRMTLVYFLRVFSGWCQTKRYSDKTR